MTVEGMTSTTALGEISSYVFLTKINVQPLSFASGRFPSFEENHNPNNSNRKGEQSKNQPCVH